MSNRPLFCASIVLIGVVYGCRPADPHAGSSTSGISSAKPNSTATGQAGKDLWNLPDTDKPIITDKPPAPNSLAEQTERNMPNDFVAANDPRHRAIAKRATPGDASADENDPKIDRRAADHKATVPNEVMFGKTSDAGAGYYAPVSYAYSQTAAGTQLPCGTSPDIFLINCHSGVRRIRRRSTRMRSPTRRIRTASSRRLRPPTKWRSGSTKPPRNIRRTPPLNSTIN